MDSDCTVDTDHTFINKVDKVCTFIDKGCGAVDIVLGFSGEQVHTAFVQEFLTIIIITITQNDISDLFHCCPITASPFSQFNNTPSVYIVFLYQFLSSQPTQEPCFDHMEEWKRALPKCHEPWQVSWVPNNDVKTSTGSTSWIWLEADWNPTQKMMLLNLPKRSPQKPQQLNNRSFCNQCLTHYCSHITRSS